MESGLRTQEFKKLTNDFEEIQPGLKYSKLRLHTPTKFKGNSSWETERIVARTQAAPPISALISSIAAEGLIDMPPLSKVTPLPVTQNCIQDIQM